MLKGNWGGGGGEITAEKLKIYQNGILISAPPVTNSNLVITCD